jgi:Zn-dependent oligopeptidase
MSRDLADQQETIARLRTDIESLDAAGSASLARIDARLAEVVQQFSNQFLELGNEIDHALSRHPSAADLPIDELRAAQERLASEQARYQIAFREDLARLADDLRRRGLS